jgi:hypothetical protein
LPPVLAPEEIERDQEADQNVLPPVLAPEEIERDQEADQPEVQIEVLAPQTNVENN